MGLSSVSRMDVAPFLLHLYAALEKERALRSQRTKPPWPPQRPVGRSSAIPGWDEARTIGNAAQKAEAEAHADIVLPAIREAQAAGTIAAALNGRGIATARGAKWEATTVRNILRAYPYKGAVGINSGDENGTSEPRAGSDEYDARAT